MSHKHHHHEHHHPDEATTPRIPTRGGTRYPGGLFGVLARILAALRMPAGDEEEDRPQRRVGVRGVYGLGAAS